MNLKKQATFSMIWISFGSLFSNILRFLVKLILARILVPADFGIFAMVLLFINSLMLFSNIGLTNALIHRKKEFDRAANTVFYILFFIGVFLAILAFLLSSQVALFFKEPDLTAMIRFFSLGIIFVGIELVPSAILIKKFMFGRKIFVECLSVTTFFLISILLAYAGFGVWSLIIGQICSMFINSFGMFIISGFRPKFDFSLRLLKELLGYGKHLMIMGIVGFLICQGDDLFIGKVLGTIALGYYAIAYAISSLPIKIISLSVASLSFPIFVKLRDKKDDLQKAYLKILRLSFLVILPIAFGIFIISPEFIKIILGNKWIPSIHAIQILCFFTVFRAFHHVGGYFFQSIGNPKLHRDVVIFEFLGLVVLIYPFSIYYGIVGTSIAVTLSCLVGALYLFLKVRQKLGFKRSEDLRIIFLEVLSTIMMVSILFILKKRFLLVTQPLQLVWLIIVGVIIYFAFISLLMPRIIIEIKTLIKISLRIS